MTLAMLVLFSGLSFVGTMALGNLVHVNKKGTYTKYEPNTHNLTLF